MKQRPLLLIFSLITSSVFAQDTLTISLQEFLARANERNKQAKLADKEAMIARADFRQSNALYLPTVSASYTAITTNNPLMAFGSKVNQEILAPQDFNPALLNNPDNVQNYATEILVMQPLLNLDGVYERNAASIQQEAYQLKAARTREYVALEATKLYMMLQLSYEAVHVMTREQHAANQAVKMISDYLDQGLVQKADVLDAQVRENEVSNQLKYAVSNVQNTSDQLLVFMGDQPGSTVLRPQERAPSDYAPVEYDESLPENRKDILAMEKAVEGYEHMLKSSRMKLLPRINAFGSFQIYDDTPVGFGASGYVLGAKLSWNLFNGYADVAKAGKSKLQVEKAMMEQEDYNVQQQAELKKAIRMLSDARNKVELSVLAVRQSTESYQIRKDRFEQGLEKTIDLLATETQLYQKELQLQQAIFEYNFTKEYLHFLTRE